MLTYAIEFIYGDTGSEQNVGRLADIAQRNTGWGESHERRAATRDEAEQKVTHAELVDDLSDRPGSTFATLAGDGVSTTKGPKVTGRAHLRIGRGDDHSARNSRAENLARCPRHGRRRLAYGNDVNRIGAWEGLGMLFEHLRDQTGGIHRTDRRVETRSGVLAKPTAATLHRCRAIRRRYGLPSFGQLTYQLGITRRHSPPDLRFLPHEPDGPPHGMRAPGSSWSGDCGHR